MPNICGELNRLRKKAAGQRTIAGPLFGLVGQKKQSVGPVRQTYLFAAGNHWRNELFYKELSDKHSV